MKKSVTAFLIVSSFATFIGSAFAVESVSASAPCVQAAVAEVYKTYPVNQPVKAKFYEWGSSTSAGWQTFKKLINKGFDIDSTSPRYASEGEVADEIKKDYSAIGDTEKQQELLEKIKGKKILSLDFRFNEGDLGTYYLIKKESAESCEVEHLDQKIDDFDNG